MHRIVEDLLGIRQLDNLPKVHDRDPVADILDHAQVVGDKNISQVAFLFELHQQVEHLRLDRNVER